MSSWIKVYGMFNTYMNPQELKQFETIQTTDGYKPKTTYTTTRYKNKFVGDYTYKILTTEIVSEEIQYIAG